MMRTLKITRDAIFLFTAATITLACQQQPTPTAEVHTTTGEQPRMEPISVVGCLKGGTLSDTTWVLLERSSDGSALSKPATTYQLVGAGPEILSDHAGRVVRVSGTLESEQQVASHSTGVAKHDDEAKGTGGTPRVDTTAALDVKRLRVDRVEPIGSRCE